MWDNNPLKKLEKRGRKILDKLPGVGVGKEIIGALEDVGKSLGLGKSEADKRKDRTRAFHDDLRKGRWSEIEKTAEVEGALGGKGTRFKGLALEALWVLAQRDKGYSLPEIIAALGGTETGPGLYSLDSNTAQAKEARGGRLPNLDGTSNFTSDKWLAQRSSAGGSTETGSTSDAPEPEASPSTSPRRSPAAPSAPKPPRPTRTSSPSSTPSGPKPCAPGKERNPATGRCRKIPAPPASQPQGFADTGAVPRGCPPGKELNPATGRCRAVCKYGRDPLTDRCRPKPPASAASKRSATAKKRVEREVGKKIDQGARYVYKTFGPLGTIKLLAKGTLVATAGLAAYALTKKLATLRPKTWADAHSELAKAYREAKQEVRLSRPDLDWSGGPETQRNNELVFGPLNAWFKEREAVLDGLEAARAWPKDYKGNALGYVFDDDNPTYGDPFKN